MENMEDIKKEFIALADHRFVDAVNFLKEELEGVKVYKIMDSMGHLLFDVRTINTVDYSGFIRFDSVDDKTYSKMLFWNFYDHWHLSEKDALETLREDILRRIKSYNGLMERYEDLCLKSIDQLEEVRNLIKESK